MVKLTATTASLILIKTHLLNQLSFAEVTNYSTTTKIKCHSLVDVGNYDNLKCATMCMQYRAMTGLSCMAFNVSNSVCTLCINGPVSRTKQVIWSSTEEVYATTVHNFDEELEKGKIRLVQSSLHILIKPASHTQSREWGKLH